MEKTSLSRVESAVDTPALVPVCPQRRWSRLIGACFGALLLWSANNAFRSYRSQKALLCHPREPVEWEKCDDVIVCGRLEVPLDYHNLSAGVASLALAKYPATKPAERLGTVFLNPGGPGGSGVGFVYRIGRNISELLDGRYDIVSWDPRGINGTLPRVECFASQTEQDIFYAHTAQEAGIAVQNVSDPLDLAAFKAQAMLEDARNTVLIELCVNRTGEQALRNVGTATVVRDLERLSTVLEGEHTPVNFWGFSYGTIVGSYFVNMFPDRVGRVVIDGVVDPILWSQTHPVTWPKDDYEDVESVFTGFVDSCSKTSPEHCSLVANYTTSDAIRGAIDKLYSDLFEQPMSVANAQRPAVLTAGALRDFLFTYMYRPRSWPELSSVLSSAIAGNGAPILNYVQNVVELNTSISAQTAFAISAITCVDNIPYSTEERKDWWEEAVDAVKAGVHVSPRFGGMGVPDVCPQWEVKGVEWFDGPWNSTLANDILIIGNSHDPITPLVNAKTVHSMLNQSTLIQHDGYGHCSLGQISLCTAGHVRAYFLRGILPPEREIVCPVSEPLFPSIHPGIEAWIAVPDEDRKLAQVLHGLGRDFDEFGRDTRRSPLGRRGL